MEGRDFIITSLQVWDLEIGSTIKNTALEISKTNRVLYINTPMDHITWLKGGDKPSYKQRMEVIRGTKPHLRQLNENMWVADCPFMVYSINKIGFAPLFDAMNRINNKRIAKFISKVVEQLGFKDYIHIIDNDIYRSQYMKEMLGANISIYYRRDYVIGEKYWRRHGARLEPKLCAKSDMVLTNSLHYANQLRCYNANIHDVIMGVNITMYDPYKERTIPNDIKDIPHPIVGYLGSINSTRLDAQLMLDMAKSRAQYSFVFTGPEDEFFAHHELHSLPNVHFLGNKPVGVLPDYIACYDVCINPQMLNDITIGNYPLKIDEYLAMGKPIVATKTPTMEHLFASCVHLANSAEEYLLLIDKALTEVDDKQKREQRIAFSKIHTWEQSVKQIFGFIKEYYK